MIAVALLLLISGANARPEGAPITACETMVPNHGNGIVRQQGPSPYSVKTLRQQGDVLVTIKSSIEIPLTGLMLQARIRDGELAGVFETTSSDVRAMNCIQPGDTVTYSNPHARSAVEVRWKPPFGYVGPVIFNATVAQDHSTFWVGVESETLLISKRYQDDEEFEEPPGPAKAATPPHYAPEEATPPGVTSDSFYDGCGAKKFCFGTPDGCVENQDCKAAAAVTVSGDRYEFEMKAVGSPAWVGVGLSDDDTMGDDSVIECVTESAGSVEPYLSWTTPRPELGVGRITNPQHGIQLLSSSAVDGTLYCKVLRDPKTTINGKEFDLVNTKYFVLVAAGSSLKPNGVGFHGIGALSSSSSRYLSHYAPEEVTPPGVTSDSFYDGCGAKKLCFGILDGCVENRDCKAVAAVTVSGDRYEFEMKALGSPAWVGVGLSDDDKMGDDSVIECVIESAGSVEPYLSWTTPRPDLGVGRITNPQQGIQLLSSSAVDGTLYCKVLRDTKTTINGKEFDLVNTKYFVLVAAGSSLKPNGVGFHRIGALSSSSSRYLSDVSDVKGASKILLRLHGAFMLAAWIGTASLGTFVARYYRKTWVGRTIFGKDLWFVWHRCLMVLTWALTSAAFILIFVELKAWSTENNPHAILGCIVTALCFMQPVGAFFRPHPGTPKRRVFNWMHWLAGNSAHILAIVTIFFAVKLNKAELPDWFDWILVAFVAFHVLMHLVLSILSCVSDNSSSQRASMKDLNTSEKMSAHIVNQDAPLSGARKLLLGLYVLVVGSLTTGHIVVALLAPIT